MPVELRRGAGFSAYPNGRFYWAGLVKTNKASPNNTDIRSLSVAFHCFGLSRFDSGVMALKVMALEVLALKILNLEILNLEILNLEILTLEAFALVTVVLAALVLAVLVLLTGVLVSIRAVSAMHVLRLQCSKHSKTR